MVAKKESGLSARDVDHFRHVLEERRRLKVVTIERLRQEAVEDAELEDETTVPVERGTADLERAEYAELSRINEALRRLIDGHYGLCEDCARAIGRDRLELLPTTSRCVECQERVEAA
ncbi:MAG TPA: TraR/DksA family transcriptional regulator [Planctomycetota bacterium]